MRLMLKILIIAGLSLAILIPLVLIRAVIHDREQHRAAAVSRIASSEAGAQTLSAPVLVVPYTERVEVEQTDDQGRSTGRVWRDRSGVWTFFPKTMEMTGTMAPYLRQLGLHDVRMYALGGQLSADFDVRIPEDAEGLPPRRIGTPWVGYTIADVRGLRGAPRLRIDGSGTALHQGSGSEGGSGVHALLAQPVLAGAPVRLRTVLDFELSGAETLAVVPLADENTVTLDSPWPHPQFNGRFLPRAREVGTGGFHAEWAVSSLASDAQLQYRNGTRAESHTASLLRGHGDAGVDVLGISLVDPVDAYTRADRASKYGIVFVLLTFTAFFMFEMLRGLRIHPIQYGLVGLALAIFFLLLLGLSEHIAFDWAYLAASGACIGLIGVYLAAVLRSRLRGLGFAAGLGLLYAALFGLLISEDNALVLGAGLLFVILAAIMLVTRRVDWYQVAVTPTATPPPLPR
ncbi:cell envelope integrity protein CreD [Luteimonas sp. 3794]|uniref:cell envelope integrity protein CreD n=1 Tax=Luteimonas sp. 3794 TaxID=2817730 RepID=UPI00286545AA|nr:cell envelope integrity protein CreD [Luteimonas sp. 3794]MDR6992836.1 inner membrane protein [Luteimonas sp. 3794]